MDAEIAIVGGGPAGSAVALALARLDPALAQRTVLLEAARHPRPKPCGGGLTGNLQDQLDWYGLALQGPDVPIRRTRVVCGRVSQLVPLERPFRVVRRDVFDGELFATAAARGVRVREGAKVEAVEPDGRGVTVRIVGGETLRVRAVVAADGVRSKVARALGPRRTIALLQADLPREDDGDDTMVYDFSWLHRGLRGYFWAFPSLDVAGRPTMNVGLMQAEEPPGALLDTLNAWLAQRGATLARRDVKAWPAWAFDPRYPFAAPRVLTVGDAAGIDPLFCEGLSHGFSYGRLAAEALVDAFRRGDFSMSGYRRAVLGSELGGEMRTMRFGAWLVYHDRMARHGERLFGNRALVETVALQGQGRYPIHQRPVRWALRVAAGFRPSGWPSARRRR